MKKRPLFNIGIYLAAIVLLADQLSKGHILSEAVSGRTFQRVNAFLNFRLNWNHGVTFGLFSDHGALMPYVLIGIALLILLLLLRWLAQAQTLTTALGIGFVAGGAIGNVIDRVRFGAVVDFIDVHWAGYHWYTFNLADSAIVIGVGLLLLENVLWDRHKR